MRPAVLAGLQAGRRRPRLSAAPLAGAWFLGLPRRGLITPVAEARPLDAPLPVPAYHKERVALSSRSAVASELAGGAPVALVTSVAARGHPEKAGKHPHGEDAFFICKDESALGVADGVSQWVDVDVDAGEYARLLMDSCKKEIAVLAARRGQQGAGALRHVEVDPKEVLERAYRTTLSTVGSSTACVLVLEDDGTLRAANLGDSGFLVIRCGPAREPPFAAFPASAGEGAGAQDAPPSPPTMAQQLAAAQAAQPAAQWEMVYRSNDMQKFFNCPDQLGPGCPDRPARAETYALPVQPGDIVITATDGLFDNLSENEICLLVRRLSATVRDLFPGFDFRVAHAGMEPRLDKWLTEIARQLVNEAHTIGLSQTARTPFRKQCLRAGYAFEGGKLDDTVAVCGMVVRR